MKRVFSGARPTGKQHIGNYLGAIQNYVSLQNQYECIYCVVDVHALTTAEETSHLKANTIDMAIDWLAAGIDPKRSIVFVQSHVPEVMQLYTLLGMLTPLSWLLRVPTFKEKAKAQPHNVNHGLVGYPVLQTADIILYKAELVPVGEDQLPHLELAREIVRRFNTLYGDVFPEPVAKLTEFPNVMGLDGAQKMSKSYGNTIDLASSAEETRIRVMSAVTDPARKLRSDPGHPSICNVFRLHGHFSPESVNQIMSDCSSAGIGCVDCKKRLSQQINDALAPFREKRNELANRPQYILDVLADGASRARRIAIATMEQVDKAIGFLRLPDAG
jgi:tryptophanyl-tRNA synthetase